MDLFYLPSSFGCHWLHTHTRIYINSFCLTNEQTNLNIQIIKGKCRVNSFTKKQIGILPTKKSIFTLNAKVS